MSLIDQLYMPATKHWHDEEFHETKVTMDAVALSTSKVVRLPTLQGELKAFAAALRRLRHLLRPAQVALYEAQKVWKQVHAVWVRAIARRIILENCKRMNIYMTLIYNTCFIILIQYYICIHNVVNIYAPNFQFCER